MNFCFSNYKNIYTDNNSFSRKFKHILNRFYVNLGYNDTIYIFIFLSFSLTLNSSFYWFSDNRNRFLHISNLMIIQSAISGKSVI